MSKCQISMSTVLIGGPIAYSRRGTFGRSTEWTESLVGGQVRMLTEVVKGRHVAESIMATFARVRIVRTFAVSQHVASCKTVQTEFLLLNTLYPVGNRQIYELGIQTDRIYLPWTKFTRDVYISRARTAARSPFPSLP